MSQILDIVELIKNNPIKNFNREYQNKFIEKIKEKFNENQINLFVASFYSYLNYDKEKDYVIDLNDIWKWLGFSRKDNCKVVLEKHFEKNKDYKILLLVQERKNEGGFNKETILMNIKTFKKLCLKSCTKKADDIHDYFIKLEEIFHEIINEESNELKEQLKLKDRELIEKELELLKNKEKILIKDFHEKDIVYIIRIEDNLYKFGSTNSIKRRLRENKKCFGNESILLFCIESKDNMLLENKLKEYLSTTDYRVEREFFGKNYTELINIEEKSLKIIIDKLIQLNELSVDTKKMILKLKNRILELETELEQYKIIKPSIISKDIYDIFIDNELEYNKDNRVALSVVSKKFYTYIKDKNIDNNLIDENIMRMNKFNYKNFEIELIKYLKRKYDNKVIYREGDRTKRSVFINLSLKNYCTFYDLDIYNKFIEEYIEIKTKEKVDGNTYKYKENVTDVLNKFEEYIKEKNIKEIIEIKTGGITLRRRELKKVICDVCDTSVQKCNYTKGQLQTFVGIKLKN